MEAGSISEVLHEPRILLKKILYDLGLTNTDVFLKMVEAGEYDKEFVYKGLTYGLGYGGVLGLFTFTIDLP